MELSEIKEIIKNLKDIHKPALCVELRNELSGYLMDYEQENYELELALSTEWLKLRETAKTDTQATKLQEIGPLFRRSEQVKMLMKQILRMRGDIKNWYEVLLNKHYRP